VEGVQERGEDEAGNGGSASAGVPGNRVGERWVRLLPGLLGALAAAARPVGILGMDTRDTASTAFITLSGFIIEGDNAAVKLERHAQFHPTPSFDTGPAGGNDRAPCLCFKF